MAVLMPKIGQSMELGTVIRWHAADGDEVQEGQVIVSIETDKASYELESPASGTLHIVVPEGEEVPVETVIGTIGAGAPGRNAGPAPAFAASPPAVSSRGASPRGGRVLASPKARRLAGELGIDLARVTASSPDGVISAEDVERAAAATTAQPAETVPAAEGLRVRERRKLTGIRRTAARRLQEAWQTIPHIVQMVDVDASGLLAERARLQARGVNVALNDLLIVAAAGVMTAHPDLNARLDGDELVLYDGVDVGLAVDTPRGLLVPVVRDAGALDVESVAAETARLIEAARAGSLKAEEIGGASVTVSNLGAFGIRAGTPVISPGEPALIFVGAIEDRAVAGPSGVETRKMLTLSIAYDHRIADGAAAAAFTRDLKVRIEAFGGLAAGPADGDALGPRELHAVSAGDSYRVDMVGYGGRRWVLDEPAEDGGSGTGPTPVDALLAGLLGCITISFKFAARRRGVPIERIEGWVAANARGHLKTVSIELEVWSPAPEPDVRALLEMAERGCFVSGALDPALAVEIDLRVCPPEA